MSRDKYNLMSRTKEELIELIEKLTDRLGDEERLELIAKWISPQAALEEAQERYSFFDEDKGGFLEKVESFCSDCMEGCYYYDDDDDDDDYYGYFYDDDDTDFDESEWAQTFSSLLKLSVIYSKNKDYDIAYAAFEKLMGCLYEAESDEEILGTCDPTDFIKVDWDEVFTEYFTAMKNQLPNLKRLADKAVEVWIKFGERCSDAILNIFDEITYVEQSIKKYIARLTDNWPDQHSLYELLKRLYFKLGLEFDEIEMIKPLVRYTPYFKIDLAQGYMNRGLWDEAIVTIKSALNEVRFEPLTTDLNVKLTDCYEHLNRFDEALDVASELFDADFNHEMYIKARGYAVKLDKLDDFIGRTQAHVLSARSIHAENILMKIQSYEGLTANLIDTAKKAGGYPRYEKLKYVSKSFIYRALGTETVSLPALQGYLQDIRDSGIAGIADMVRLPEDSDNRTALMQSAVGILKLMVQHHIDGAQRERYARAAYYCTVLKDIHIYLNEEEEFNRYYVNLLNENNRKSALKDEMKKAIR